MKQEPIYFWELGCFSLPSKTGSKTTWEYLQHLIIIFKQNKFREKRDQRSHTLPYSVLFSLHITDEFP